MQCILVFIVLLVDNLQHLLLTAHVDGWAQMRELAGGEKRKEKESKGNIWIKAHLLPFYLKSNI